MDYRQHIVESGIEMASSELTVETWGNISIRDKETGLVYITPSAMNYSKITRDDVVVLRMDGSIAEGSRKPSVEKEMHIALYKARPEVNAVIHTHPIYSMVYACQGREIPLIIDEAAQVLGDTIKTAKYELPGTKALANAVVDALGQRANACLLRSHGAVGVGTDMDDAFRIVKVLEMTARIYYLIESSGGKTCAITSQAVAAMQKYMRDGYGQDK